MKKISSIFAIISLIISNLIPLFGVLYFQWNVYSLMILYWLENVLIGVFTVIKMRKAEGSFLSSVTSNFTVNGRKASSFQHDSLTAQRTFFIPFFSMHFGIFTLVHGIFVLIFFYSPDVSFRGIALTFLSMCLSHFISYETNFIGKGEYLHTSIEKLFIAPYPRVIVMHLTVILGGMFAMQNKSIYSLVLLVVLKTIADLGSHLFEHRTTVAKVGKGVGVTLDSKTGSHKIGELTYQSKNFKIKD